MVAVVKFFGAAHREPMALRILGPMSPFLDVTSEEWNTFFLPKQRAVQAASPTILEVAQSQPVMGGWQTKVLLFRFFPDF